jgi:hypothetical protein
VQVASTPLHILNVLASIIYWGAWIGGAFLFVVARSAQCEDTPTTPPDCGWVAGIFIYYGIVLVVFGCAVFAVMCLIRWDAKRHPAPVLYWGAWIIGALIFFLFGLIAYLDHGPGLFSETGMYAGAYLFVCGCVVFAARRLIGWLIKRFGLSTTNDGAV